MAQIPGTLSVQMVSVTMRQDCALKGKGKKLSSCIALCINEIQERGREEGERGI